ncbi:unnamed protein product [Fraxinus pennsylvanica]|uniref:VTT domain-containing protein n=1 Tax=Fraxinus pennsylvanica TaxID=56036 RepID=A0AAD2EE66_9LAMI|nr:unnamed protein product [Fraxinus pennsylvanica]
MVSNNSCGTSMVIMFSKYHYHFPGMTFRYGYGFLLIIVAVAFGVSIPYFVGSIFHPKIQAWLDRHPKKATTIRLAGEGTWFNQFQAIASIRISPFPCLVYNYGAVASDVTYGPYLLGTLVGMMQEMFVAIYTFTNVVIFSLSCGSSNDFIFVDVLLGRGSSMCSCMEREGSRDRTPNIIAGDFGLQMKMKSIVNVEK